MFHWDRGLKLTQADLALDIARRQPRSFISHAHGDHIARHMLAFCTPETARLYRHRLGQRDVFELPYLEPREFAGLTLTAYPAGHCLGSAMLWASDGRTSLLYTGDFKLGPVRTSRPAELPTADVLIMESTYGLPHFRHPTPEAILASLGECLEVAKAQRRVPVFQAYTLGKAQELTRLLNDLGVPVLQQRDVFRVSRVYQDCGVDLGTVEEYPGYWRPGWAVVVPPRFHQSKPLPRLPPALQIAVTGWASDPRMLAKWGADRALALSDHADYAQLLETIDRVGPREVYALHGPVEFVELLRAQGIAAWRADGRDRP